MGGPEGAVVDDVGAVSVLMGGKLVIDLSFHVLEHLGVGRATNRSVEAST
jgi:hypothetical protein